MIPHLLRTRDRRGSNAVEFALTMPILILIIAGIVDYGWFFSQHQIVVTAVREASRAAALTPEDGDAVAEAQARAQAVLTQAGMDASAATVTTTFSGAPPDVLVEVEVSTDFEPLMGTLATLGTNVYPSQLRARLVARMEDQ
jgi:Flp pilus assembly protein TadG